MREGDGRHRLVRLREAGRGERARLVTPEGREVELTREKWLRLAVVVGQMFGTGATALAKPARRRPANHGRPWTEPLDAEFTACWRKGETLAALAARLGRTQGALESRLVVLELVHPRTRQPLTARTGAEVGGAGCAPGLAALI